MSGSLSRDICHILGMTFVTFVMVCAEHFAPLTRATCGAEYVFHRRYGGREGEDREPFSGAGTPHTVS